MEVVVQDNIGRILRLTCASVMCCSCVRCQGGEVQDSAIDFNVAVYCVTYLTTVLGFIPMVPLSMREGNRVLDICIQISLVRCYTKPNVITLMKGWKRLCGIFL